ncbi:2OG-Fe(II) oxygenase [Hassallia byssoidea VB512170]|uniref:2OG-Fe(II) oxygenase n=1 Tax=Hassallia byssoidea VB512170 TaxID=1304833 RepID=A0A846HH55_9CYAN|nr:phytanoyl-CoA dioxygenase (PhyH) [Hassalia byssoidea]NEU75960.1 2OG-Fe(II) oxygenase [Hassalia byssoidea VB512170]
MYILVQKARNKIIRKLTQIPFVQAKSELVYQTALNKHLVNLPVLSTSDRALVETIKRDGVVITSLSALGIPSNPRFFQVAKKLKSEIPKSISGQKNEFVVHATSQQMMEHPEIFLWGLEERLLNIVENYLGLPVAYQGVFFRRDIANEVAIKSRLWHIDLEDRKVLKIIVYLNDVNEDGGPFQYIPQSLTSTVARSLKYRSGYIRDETMQQVLSPSNWKSCTGLAGTVIFAATSSIFHRGKTPVADDRFAVFFDYTSRQPKHQLYSTLSLNQENLLSLVNNLSKPQKDCVFWQQHN